jgi:hypothetical protein
MAACAGSILVLAMAVVGGFARGTAAEEPRPDVCNWSD